MSPAKIKPAPDGVKQVLIRVPAETHRELVVVAEQQKRSVNGHLNFLIEQSLKEEAA